MPSVNIVKPFTFTHTFVPDRKADDGSVHPQLSTTDQPQMHGKEEFFPAGTHEMSEAMANHWYVLAHTDNPPQVPPKPGTPEYGARQAAAERRRLIVQASIEQEASLAAADIRQDALASGRFAEVEEQVAAEEQEHAQKAAEDREKNDAARTGRRAAMPRRQITEPRNNPQPAQGGSLEQEQQIQTEQFEAQRQGQEQQDQQQGMVSGPGTAGPTQRTRQTQWDNTTAPAAPPGALPPRN